MPQPRQLKRGSSSSSPLSEQTTHFVWSRLSAPARLPAAPLPAPAPAPTPAPAPATAPAPASAPAPAPTPAPSSTPTPRASAARAPRAPPVDPRRAPPASALGLAEVPALAPGTTASRRNPLEIRSVANVDARRGQCGERDSMRLTSRCPSIGHAIVKSDAGSTQKPEQRACETDEGQLPRRA